MEVVLLKDIKRLGKAGDVRTVADGYARNYLIPRGLAEAALPGTVQQARDRVAVQAKRLAQEHTQAETLAGQLSGQSLTFKARAGETGHLYGSITAGDIAEELQKRSGKAVDKRKIALEEPIRELGTYQVPIKLGGDVSATVTVIVEKEE